MPSGTMRCRICARRSSLNWVPDPLLATHYPDPAPSLSGQYFNLRKTTIYAGSTEIQKNIICQDDPGSLKESRRGLPLYRGTTGAAGDVCAASLPATTTSSAAERSRAPRSGFSADAWAQYAELGLLALPLPEEYGGLGGNGVDVMAVMEQVGEGLLLEPYLSTVVLCGGIISPPRRPRRSSSRAAADRRGQGCTSRSPPTRPPGATSWPTSPRPPCRTGRAGG